MFARSITSFFAFLVLAALAAAQAPPYKPSSPTDPALSRDEAIALAYMRTVVNAQKLYVRKNGRYAPSLNALVGTGSVTRRMAESDRANYTVSFRGGEKSYSLTLTPKEFAPDRRAFFVNESGNIRVEEGEEATEESAILRPPEREEASSQE